MFNYKKKQKAQVSAPFELLVAIIVMIFVIIAGNYALSNLNENTCLGNKRQDFSNLSTYLRDVTLGSDLAYRTIDFTTKACYNETKETINLQIREERDICERYCGSGTSCVLLFYNYIDEEKMDYKLPIEPVCTYLPTNIQFGSALDCGSDTDNSRDVAIDPIDNIPLGRYKIWKISDSSTQTSHKICMVKTG